MEFDEDYIHGEDVESDSDTEDTDHESQLSQWLGELKNYAKELESGDAGTVRRRQKAVVTPKMAMESFRYSFLSENHDINFDAILGELNELEHHLGTDQSELPYYKHSQSDETAKDDNHDSGNDLAQSELDALAMEITQSLGYNSKHKRQIGEIEYVQIHYPGNLVGYSDAMLDIAETDSAFSESASLPSSSESFTSMVTVSSAADTAGIGDGSNVTTAQTWQFDEDQQAKINVEKIRHTLEKIKDAKIKKLFVRAFACDGSSKSIMVDENMSILEVMAVLADKNHIRLNPDVAVVEHMPEIYMERILEDHDFLVDSMEMWTSDTKNKILFENRPQKNDLFKCPERYLHVSSSSEKVASLNSKRQGNLIQEFFTGNAAQVPEVEDVLYLKSDGKKAWKKYLFVLRTSGLYYNPKGTISKSPKDLTCLVQFEFVELYIGLHWKKKYHSPTDFCFALKHPQIQKKSSKYIQYLCAENKAALDQWMIGIRIAKFGKQLLTNYLNLQREILAWDTRDNRATISNKHDTVQLTLAEFNKKGNLNNSHNTVPQNNLILVRDSCNDSSEDVNCIEIDTVDRLPEIKSSVSCGQTSEHVKTVKPFIKKVSFSNTHCIIDDSGEEVVPVKHRDSITSTSTDCSEDSSSSGEGIRFGGMAHRGSKLRAKLPVTTGTTKHLSEMVLTSIEGASVISEDESLQDWRSGVIKPIQRSMSDRWKSPPMNAVGELLSERKLHGSVRDHRFVSHMINYDPLPVVSASPDQNCHIQNKGQKGIISTSAQKGPYKSHSRGSSISSVDSYDSYQGYIPSPTGFDSSHLEQSQFSWDQPKESYSTGPGCQSYNQIHGMSRQRPPTAQKPLGNKISQIHSESSTGSVERGHTRNASKSSLESVEEIPAEDYFHDVIIPVSCQECPSSHCRSSSQTCTSDMKSAAPILIPA